MKKIIVSLLIAICLCVMMGKTSALAESVDTTLIATNNSSVVLDNCELVKPGPPKTFFCQSLKKYYKLFNNESSANEMKKKWDTADKEGIPLPEYGVAPVRYQNKDMSSFWTKKAPGTFFQLAKKLDPLKIWINNQTDKKILTDAKRLFSNVRNKLGDAQGFVEQEKKGGKITFIDINIPGTSPNADDVVQKIETRLKEIA
jgi:hypothetical protein